MENGLKDFDLQLSELKPKVREKALEIAAVWVCEKDMAKDAALKKGIEQAEN